MWWLRLPSIELMSSTGTPPPRGARVVDEDAEEGRVRGDPSSAMVASEVVMTSGGCSVVTAMAAGDPGMGRLSMMSGMSIRGRSGEKRRHCSAAFMKQVLPVADAPPQVSMSTCSGVG